ncbi:MAG: ABC transporter permease [Saprospiraceae bacterium]|nr:ABC transporter permease [Saprospiraceae bacterium]
MLEVSWLNLACSVVIAYMIAVFVAFSLGTFLSAINVKYRDVRYVLPFLIQTLFFVTPVMYDTSIIKQSWIQAILILNPLNFTIDLIRHNMTNLSAFHWPHLSLWIPLVMIALYIISIYTFRKTEAYFADIV